MDHCKIDGCDREDVYAKSLCRSHYDKALHAKDHPIIIKNCQQCGASLNAKTRRKRFCGAACHAKSYKDSNRDRYKAYGRNWYARNTEKAKGWVSEYQSDNKDRLNAYKASRKRRTRQATPPWADTVKIRAIYAARPAGFEVDHVIPLKGKCVSGLHVHDNLQYLPLADNRRKHASYNTA